MSTMTTEQQPELTEADLQRWESCANGNPDMGARQQGPYHPDVIAALVRTLRSRDAEIERLRKALKVMAGLLRKHQWSAVGTLWTAALPACPECRRYGVGKAEHAPDCAWNNATAAAAAELEGT